jgi:hypothetical protein
MTNADIIPRIEEDKLGRLLGRKNQQNYSPALASNLQNWNERLDELLKPQISYMKRKIQKIENGCVYITEDLKFKSARLARSLKGSAEIVCFVATLGNDIEKKISELMDDNRLSESYILDSMGSVAVENLVDQFQKRIEAHSLKIGKSVTLRFSPGYCDWPITEQKKLFSLFDKRDFPVTLTDTCLMEPRKSVSGVFGVLSKENGKPLKPYNPCIMCWKKDCIARRV